MKHITATEARNIYEDARSTAISKEVAGICKKISKQAKKADQSQKVIFTPKYQETVNQLLTMGYTVKEVKTPKGTHKAEW